MIDYAKNIQAFYERDDYKALAGQSGATAVLSLVLMVKSSAVTASSLASAWHPSLGRG